MLLKLQIEGESMQELTTYYPYAYPSGHLVPSPTLGLANAPIVETKFLELAMSLLDFSPRIPLGTFSILLSQLLNRKLTEYEIWLTELKDNKANINDLTN